MFFFGLFFFVQNYGPIRIAFPQVAFLCIPARLFFFPRFLEGWALLLLDGDDIEIDESVALKEETVQQLHIEGGKHTGAEKPMKIVDVDDV